MNLRVVPKFHARRNSRALQATPVVGCDHKKGSVFRSRLFKHRKQRPEGFIGEADLAVIQIHEGPHFIGAGIVL